MSMRSLLFVPAKEKMIEKVGKLEADAYILDLEDSIENQNKESALDLLVDKLKIIDYSTTKVIVRLNKDRYISEIEKLHCFDVGFMLPKFEGINEYNEIKQISDTHEIIALVETPRGIVSIEQNANCESVHGLAFGAEDFTVSMGMINDIKYLLYQKSKLVTCARAYGKKVYDTPSFQLEDINKFQTEVDDAFALGFDGKMAINPKHVPYINDTFAGNDLEFMKKIIEEYEAKQQAVLVINGKVYEKMHIAHMKKILRESKGE